MDQLVVRPLTSEEGPRWNELVSTHHYRKDATLVGEPLCQVAEYPGTWLALLGWAAPARHLRPRDEWAGWSAEPLAWRRHFLANNARYCVLADSHQIPNLASRALGLCCGRICRDWLVRWGHRLVGLESFVDGQLFRGTAYKAAGWKRLEDTSGYARVAEEFYVRHERPKQLWVRALDEGAFRSLRAQSLPPALAIFEKPPPPKRQRCRVPPRRLASLADKLPRHQPDPRRPRGRWHPWPAVLNLIGRANLCGVARGQRQIAEFGRSLTQPQRRALGCRRDPDNPRYYVAPAESTFPRALVEIDPPRLEPLLLPWPDQPLGPDTDLLLALEGKHVRRSGGRASASAGGQPSQRVPATVPLQKHDRAIIAVRQWLEKTEFTGQLLALDWLPTQPQTLPPILYDHGADYLVPLKENPKTLLATAQTLLPEPLCPSGGSAPPPLPG